MGVGVGAAVGVGVPGVEGDDPPPQPASAATVAAPRRNETERSEFHGRSFEAGMPARHERPDPDS